VTWPPEALPWPLDVAHVTWLDVPSASSEGLGDKVPAPLPENVQPIASVLAEPVLVSWIVQTPVEESQLVTLALTCAEV